MKLAQRVAAVQAAEAECLERRFRIRYARETLRGELRRSATPTRILVGGVVAGFAVGLKEPKQAHQSLAGKVLGGPVFSMVLEAVLPGLLAGITAAAGLEADAEQDRADEAEEAFEEEAGLAGDEDEADDARDEETPHGPA